MFEPPVIVADDPKSCADVLVATITEERQVTARRFLMVAHWADLHHPDRDRPHLGKDRCRSQVAADGTPPVTTGAVVELGMLLHTTTHSAEALLRDVLELRHRLPRAWEAVLTGRLEGWRARQVARTTRPLSCEDAQTVDALVIEALLGLPWGRALAVVEAKVIALDPAGHETRRSAEESRHYVSTRRRSNAHGVRTMIARAAAGDIARLEAMIAHLAELLRRRGDTDPTDARRAKALAILANPALACVFLATSQTTPSTEPKTEPQPELEASAPSAVELAIEFGRVLTQLGTQAIDRLRPRSVLYLHLAAEAIAGHRGTGVVRVEDPIAGGPIGITQLRHWLAHDQIIVKPVIDPTGVEPVDSAEIPTHLREAVHLLAPYEVFPYGTQPSRQADLDHTRRYRSINNGGPPGQTSLDNLGPLGRRHHRAKTFDGFTVTQPIRGLHYWRTPTGYWYQVDHRGTHPLGTTPPAALDTAQRHDPTTMTKTEKHFRATLIHHAAA